MKTSETRSPSAEAAGVGEPTDPQALVRVILEKSPLLVYIANLEFKIVLANRALREITGYDTGDCPTVDALIAAFYPHGDEFQDRVRAMHEGWRRNEHVMGSKVVVQCKDGSQRTIAWYTSRVRVGRGPTVGYIAMGVDLTTQSTLEQWVGLLQRTLQHLHEGVVLTDASDNVIAWNQGATRLLGHQETAMQGQPLSRVFQRGERELVSRTVEAAITGATARWEGELELETASGGSKHLRVVQVRLDGEQGAPLARLTVFAPPDVTDGSGDASQRLEEIEGQWRKESQARAAAERERDELHRRFSTLDAAVATKEAAAGQIADLRGQLDLAEAAHDAAVHKASELEAQLAARGPAGETDDAVAKGVEAERARDELRVHLEQVQGTLAAQQAEAAAARARTQDADEARLRAESAAAQESEARSSAEAGRLAAESALEAERAARLAAEQAKETAEEAITAAELAAQRARDEAIAASDDAKRLVAEAQRVSSEAKLAADTLAATRDQELARRDARLKELEASLADAERELDQGEDRWANERVRLGETHRAELDAVIDKSTHDRKTIEEQLHRDILAAEERAEVERVKLLARLEQERHDLQQAHEIAEADIEARAKRALDAAHAELASAPSLAHHLATLAEVAVVSTDTAGRVVAFSGGAASLDGRSAREALGKVIHSEVLTLLGCDWKALFAKVVIGGEHRQEVTLVAAGGARRLVEIRATLVRNAQGAPVGVTEVITTPHVEGSLALHADAALGRLVGPLRDMLDLRTAAGLSAAEDSRRAGRALFRLGKVVADGATLSEIESVGRREGLSDALLVAERKLDSIGDTWREIRATLSDLVRLVDGARDPAATWRWNELVERCLQGAGAGRANRQFTDAGKLTGRGQAVIPLLTTLFAGAADGGSGLTVATAAAGGRLTVNLVGASFSDPTRQLCAWFAGEAGGEVAFTGAVTRVSLPAQLALAITPVSDEEPTSLLSYDPSQWAAVGHIAESGGEVGDTPAAQEDGGGEGAPSDAIEMEGAPEEEAPPRAPELIREPSPPTSVSPSVADVEIEDIELDDGTHEPGVDDRATLEMTGLSEADVMDPDDDLPSDHPVLSSGSVDMLGSMGDDDFMLMAGEDSVIKSADVLYLAVKSLDDGDPVLGHGDRGILARMGEAVPSRVRDARRDLPPIDDLEELFDEVAPVSEELLASADSMEAHAGLELTDDDLNDLVPALSAPSPALLAEMRSTDVEGGMKVQRPGTSQDAPSSKRRRGKRKK